MRAVSLGAAALVAPAVSAGRLSEREAQAASTVRAMVAEIDLARITGITHEDVCGVSLRLCAGRASSWLRRCLPPQIDRLRDTVRPKRQCDLSPEPCRRIRR